MTVLVKRHDVPTFRDDASPSSTLRRKSSAGTVCTDLTDGSLSDSGSSSHSDGNREIASRETMKESNRGERRSSRGHEDPDPARVLPGEISVPRGSAATRRSPGTFPDGDGFEDFLNRVGSAYEERARRVRREVRREEREQTELRARRHSPGASADRDCFEDFLNRVSSAYEERAQKVRAAEPAKKRGTANRVVSLSQKLLLRR